MAGTQLVADGLTKALQGQAFGRCREGLHLRGGDAVSRGKEAECEKTDGGLQKLKRLAVIGGALLKSRLAVGCAVLVLFLAA